MLFILPMWVNILVRTLATVALFDFADLPLGEGALLFGMVYNFIPFMIYPIYNTLQKMDRSLYRSSRRPGSIALAAVLQGHPAPLHAGRSEWYPDGIHANHLYLRYLRTADDEQHQALRYHHTRRTSTIRCGTTVQPSRSSCSSSSAHLPSSQVMEANRKEVSDDAVIIQ